MVRLFITVLNMSIGASFCILAVLLVRLLLIRAPKIFSYLLWAVVLVRLVCPVLPEADFGLTPNVGLAMRKPFEVELTSTTYHYYVPEESDQQIQSISKQGQGGVSGENGEDSHLGEIYGGSVAGTDSNAGIQEEDHAINEETISYLPNEKISTRSYPWISISDELLIAATILWVFVAMGLIIYAVVGYGLFMHGIEGKEIATPFVAGLLHPVIYLPEGLDEVQRQLVQEHERIHIRRLDYLVKPAAFLVCCVHWFNPLVWISFFLMERDMEASCDEAVIRKVGYDRRKDYANTLLGLSQGREWRAGYPIAFGENHVKSRIKGVVKMEKAGVGVAIGAVVLILAAAVLLLVNRPDHVGTEPATETLLPEEGIVVYESEASVQPEKGEMTSESGASAQPEENPADSKEDAGDSPNASDASDGQTAGFGSDKEAEDGKTISIPDIKEIMYLSNEDFPEDSNRTSIESSVAENQETIMNYDPNRARDQYEVLTLPQKDDAVFNSLGILFSYPVEGARISDGFGSRVHPVSGDVMYHLGVDFAAEEGTPIAAAADGTVVKTGFNADSGNYVILLHENGDATYYSHCKDLLVEEGENVERGEQIATVGSTGKSTGAHMHFAVSRNGGYAKPEFAEDGED